ncbi:GTP-binding protein LepA [Pseudooceanicola batsensis HTCC2597]|uniref:GTP-binding protein LepA n=1 Tax=Pseudooceanicola batsensis (strain ATCC BAA-863 / DSM 15984 / KCTC 12145 / HTCC2597) TaxID=252305 RepID=A3TTB6_PSEBH|nr:hypothetical protein [Pseudooceanicola batsensis]EAQ04893.1 GTP-binding protein LepA [Pseudooceanicola batsensis HTCC2597]
MLKLMFLPQMMMLSYFDTLTRMMRSYGERAREAGDRSTDMAESATEAAAEATRTATRETAGAARAAAPGKTPSVESKEGDAKTPV